MEIDWFKDYFDNNYADYFLRNISEEFTENQVNLIEEILELKNGDNILDIFCGLGRHSIALARRGYNVVSVDYSESYIKELRNNASKENLKISALAMDARKINFQDEFDAILLIFVSFGYFSDEENKELLKNLTLALKKDGKILIDIENRDYILKHFITEKWREKDFGLLLERHKFDPFKSRQKTKRIIILNNGERKETERDLRLYSLNEIIDIAQEAGLSIFKLFGDYDKTPFHLNAPRILASFTKK